MDVLGKEIDVNGSSLKVSLPNSNKVRSILIFT